MLSLRLTRSAQSRGRLAGFAVCGAALAAVSALPLLLWAPPGVVVQWAVSLAFEAALVAAAALFFAMSLAQLVPAIAATAAFYLLARSMATIQSIATGPLADDSAVQTLARWTLDAVALLFPRLDSVTRTEWLLYGPPSPATYAIALGGLLLYAALLVAAGLFDFHR